MSRAWSLLILTVVFVVSCSCMSYSWVYYCSPIFRPVPEWGFPGLPR